MPGGSIVDSREEENTKLQSRVEQLEDKLLRVEISKNNHERHSNTEIQGILAKLQMVI